MTLRTVAIVALLVSKSLCGVLDPIQTSGWNSSLALTSTTAIPSPPQLASSNSSSSHLTDSSPSPSSTSSIYSSSGSTASGSGTVVSIPATSQNASNPSAESYASSLLSELSSLSSTVTTILNEGLTSLPIAPISGNSTSQPASFGSSPSVIPTPSPNLGTIIAISSSKNSSSSVPAISGQAPFLAGPVTVSESNSTLISNQTSPGSPNTTSSSSLWPTAYSQFATVPNASPVNTNSSLPSRPPHFYPLPVGPSSGLVPTGSGGYLGGGYNASGTVAPSGGFPYGTAAPTGTAPYSGNQTSSRPANTSSNATTCGGTTVNIPDATLNWWYTTDFDYAAATLSVQFNSNDSYTGWTVLSATTTFDVASALAQPTYSTTTVFNTWINQSVVYYYEYTTPAPVYASTAVITQTATKPLNVSTGSGALPSNIVVTPAPASTVLPGPSSVASTALTNTPFVYFSEFAIDVESATKVQNGSFSCATSRRIHTLPSAYAIYYDQEDPDGQSEVTGDLPDDFINELHALHIPVIRLKLGTYAAEPTLLVVVDKVYAAEAVLALSTEVPGSTLLLPAPAASSAALLTLTPQVETSESSLMLPTSTTGRFVGPTGVVFIAHTEIAESTLDLPSPTTSIPKVTGTVSSPNIVAYTAIVSNTKTTLLAPSNDGSVITTTLQGNIVVTAKAATPTGVAPPPPSPQGQQSTAAVGAQLPASTSPSDGASGSNGGSSGSGGGSSGSNGGNTASGSGSGSSSAGSGSGGGESSSGSGSSGSGSGSSSSTNGNSGSGSGSSGSTDGNSGSGSSNSGSGSSNSGSGSSNSGSGSSNSGSTVGGSGSGSSGSSSSSGNSGSGTSGSGSSSGDSGSGAGASSGGSDSGSSGSDSTGGDSGSGSDGSGSSGGASGSGDSGSGTSSSGNANGGTDSSGSGSGSSNTNGGTGSSGSSLGGSSGGSSSGGSSGESSSGGSASGDGSGSGNGQSGSGVDNGGSGSSGNNLVPAPVVIGGTKTSIGPSSNAVIGSQTLVPGGPAITISGTPVSLGPSAVVIGTETHSFAASPVQSGGSDAAVITVGGSTITQAPVPVFVVDGQTVKPGQTITVNNKVISIGPENALVVDGTSVSMAAPGSPMTLTTAGETVVISSTPAFVLSGSKTLLAGGSPVVVSGTTLSLDASALIIDGSVTSYLASVTTSTPLALTIGSSTLTANAATQFLLASGNILTPGGKATISGITVSLDSEGSVAVINGATQTLAPPIITPAPLLTVDGTVFEPNLGSTFDIAGQELTPGGLIVASGTTISLANDASVAVINGVTETLSAVTNSFAAHKTSAAAVLALEGEVITAISGSTFLIHGSTLIPGEVVTLGSGNTATTISLGPSGSGDVVVNGVTSRISSSLFAVGTQAPLTIAGQVYTAGASGLPGAYVISGQTLVPGGNAISFTQGGIKETVSLSPDGTVAIINGFTSTIPSGGSSTTPGPLDVDGQIYSAIPGLDSPAYVISGQTLTEGGVITLENSHGAETISLSPEGTVLVVNGVSSTIPSAATATPGPLTVDGHVYSAIPGYGVPAYVISGQTLTEGGVITFNGAGGMETVSLSPDGTVALINGIPSTIAAPTITQGPLTIDGQTFTAVSGHGSPEYIISGQTLTTGGLISLTIGGSMETISLSPNGAVVVVNGVSSTISPAATITAAPDITVDGQIITAGKSGTQTTYLVSGKVLTPGGSVVFSGPNGVETVSLSPDGSTLVEAVSGAVTTSALPTAFAIAQTEAPIITVGDETFTALPGPGPSYLLPDGRTLYPGGQALTEKIDGRTYIVSLSPSATVLVVEEVGPNGVVTQTDFETLFPAIITKARGQTTVTTGIGSNGATTTERLGAGATQTGKNSASLQGAALSDKQIGGSLAVGVVGVALFAILL